MAKDVDIMKRLIPEGRITRIKFDLMEDEEIEKSCYVNVAEPGDLNNAKLGLPNALSECETCGSTSIRDCEGHFGVVKLPMTIYHPHLIKELVKILNQICPGCSKLKPEKQKKLQASMRSFPSSEESDLGCKYCSKNLSKWYPTLKFKKASEDIKGRKSISVIAEINEKLPKKLQHLKLEDALPKDYWDFVSGDLRKEESVPLKVKFSPRQVFNMLKKVDRGCIEQFVSRSGILFLSCLPVTPNCHRVMELFSYADGPRLCFDDRTNAFKRVVDLSRHFDELRQEQRDEALVGSHVTRRVLDCLSMSKLHSKRSADADADVYASKHGRKWLQEVILSKRSDNSFRMVVVGDPKIKLGEIGIPQDVCDELFVDERVNSYNLDKLNAQCYMLLLTKEVYIKRKGKLITFEKAKNLEIGDTFQRPLHDGDIVLINRPPSKHLHSLIALSVKVLPVQSALAINPLCCAPLDGDFDGDCLHGYVPQSINSIVELRELVSLENQNLNVQDGESLVSLTHDSLTAAHLLTDKDVFLNKFEIQQLGMLCWLQIPFPAVMKAREHHNLWSGNQLLSMLLSPCFDFLAKSKMGQSCNEEFLPDANNVRLKRYLCQVFKSCGRIAVDVLFSLQFVLCEWLSMRGLTVSLSDLYLSPDLCSRSKLIDEVSYALQEAEDASLMKRLITNPAFGLLLHGYDENEELLTTLDIETKQFKHMTHISVAAFKDVFRDLQRTVYEHIGKDNSMLAMITAGSKGSIFKLVQQSVCLGLQLANSSSFLVGPCSTDQSDDGDCEGQTYDVIKTSFIDGLNPIECFIHSVSCRPGMFKENNEIPGILTRKLMFYLRDVYLAYDGTVRSAYGQQIVQFSYYDSKETFRENEKSFEMLDTSLINDGGGQPVGSLAASSLSEAAYGALEHIPSTNLEASPLRSLKRIFECGRTNMSGRTVSLILNKSLGRRMYGYEYGALEVKNHLDRVMFSELVTSYLISYVGLDHLKSGFCPWVPHFHLDKERMTRKRLNSHLVIQRLENHYQSKQQKLAIPKLHFRSQYCPFNGKEDEQLCIVVEVETYQIGVSLESIRGCIIPILLSTLIKGFLELKKVEIQWGIPHDRSNDSDGELILKVVASENCPEGKIWNIVNDACVPIMGLIDWNRSHPDIVSDIFDVYGIGTTRQYFLKDLKTTTHDIGRNICAEHLLVVADSLTMTGEFLGLTARGLKMQRKSATMSSPFNQACFSMPKDCFIDAAKQGFEDHLCGNLDALIWGKQAAVGTGGPFGIIYSGKVQPRRSENIYETLRHLQSVTSHQEQAQPKTRILKSMDKTWKNAEKMSLSLRRILHKYKMNEFLNEEDKSLLMEALRYHPKREEKVGAGVQDIKIGQSKKHPETQCFILVRTDGTTDDFSYRKCVGGFQHKVSKNFTLYSKDEDKGVNRVLYEKSTYMLNNVLNVKSINP